LEESEMESKTISKGIRNVDNLVLKILRFLRPDLDGRTMYRLYDEYFKKLRAILVEHLDREDD
jgi:hypothetical protein